MWMIKRRDEDVVMLNNQLLAECFTLGCFRVIGGCLLLGWYLFFEPFFGILFLTNMMPNGAPIGSQNRPKSMKNGVLERCPKKMTKSVNIKTLGTSKIELSCRREPNSQDIEKMNSANIFVRISQGIWLKRPNVAQVVKCRPAYSCVFSDGLA